MLDIKKIDHVGIRVRDKDRAVAFYTRLGFEVRAQGTFEKGHPIIMAHPSGVAINLLGPAGPSDGPNVLMDIDEKHAGYTHVALRVGSLESTEAFLEAHGIEITGRLAFKDLRAVFIRDPDNNVIELDDYPKDAPETRMSTTTVGYEEHP